MKVNFLHALQISLTATAFGLWALLPATGVAEEAEPPPLEDEAVTAEAEALIAEDSVADEDEEEATIEEIVVTGSRIRRNEFSSVSPVQIIQGERSRELGLVDTASMLQGSTTASGVQIDNTFNAFVLDNGPGATNINLRGLGAGRTLLLINGRRMAPSGVGGAPTAPDLNSIPSIMIDRVDVLTDGASSVYGSDAVSGVVNVIMRQNFDGFEFEADYVQPEASGGKEAVLSAAWGRDFDRGSFGLSSEYYNRTRLQWRDRSHTSECEKYLQIDEYDVLRSDDVETPRDWPGTTLNDCTWTGINRIIILPNQFLPLGHPFGSIYYTPGETNVGIPNFSELGLNPALAGWNPAINPVDTDGDGRPDVGIIDPDRNGRIEVDIKDPFYNYNGSPRDRQGDYLAGLQRFNLYSFGNYELQDANNTSLSFELLYNRREQNVFNPGAQLFPDIPANNPYNPCNQQAPGGVNCMEFFIHPVRGPLNLGNFPVFPIIAVRGDRDRVEVEQNQVRALAAVEGDLPWGSSWSYEVFASHTWSNGKEHREGILEPQLLLSLDTSTIDPNTGNIVCGTDGNGDGIPDGQDCVPVNLLAGSLYQTGGGEFATQAERDYLFGVRSFDTTFEQTLFGAIVQGDIGKLPWNDIDIPLVLGVEYRKDKVDSQPNEVARDGLLYGFFTDRGAFGSRNLKEAYLETEFRLLEGQPMADELLLNLSGRFTNESTYGSQFTYSAKLRYSPVEALDFRASHGTSFRAPNAREQFLLGQSGFLRILDPCVVPIAARASGNDPTAPPVYDQSRDQRSQLTLENCRAAGVDPTSLGMSGGINPSYSVEIFSAGGETVQSTVDPETSTSITTGLVFRQPWFDNFDLSLSGTYWRIEVEDSISQLNPPFFVQDCYVDRSVNQSAYCRFINRGSNGLMDFINSSYFNIHKEVAAGWDWNLLFETDLVVRDRNLGLALDVRATRTNQLVFILGDITQESAGRIFAPEWQGVLTAQAEYNDFRLNWQARYTGGGEEEPEPFNPPRDTSTETCADLAVDCIPLYYTKGSWLHTASFSWRPNDWRFTLGVRNVFDKGPRLIDDDAPGTQVNNIPLGAYGGDYHIGRSVFLGVSRSLSLASRSRGY